MADPMPMPGAGGFGNDYPVAVTTGAPRPTYLRPLQQPLYDTEVQAIGGTGSRTITFFQRSLSQPMALSAINKSKAETNMTQSGQLPQPRTPT